MLNSKFYNKNIFKKAELSSLLLFLFVLLSGCSAQDMFSKLDKKIGETFNEFQEGEKKTIYNLMEERKEEIKIASSTFSKEEIANSLTRSQKEKIDKWLDKKSLNRYGDDRTAIYTGGTPLFDEKTGERIDRYVYLLNKFSNLLELIEK